MEIVSRQLKQLFGNTVEVVRREAAVGGCINKGTLLALSNGRTVFLKTGKAHPEGMLEAEKTGLIALKCSGGPVVPEPLACFADADNQYLLMTAIETGPKDKSWARRFGTAMAHLHFEKRSAEPGFGADNYIGSTPQPNPVGGTWGEFFRDHRIACQMERAIRNRLIDTETAKSLDSLLGRICELLVEPVNGMSLLHGDLWEGNTLADSRGAPVIIDPAVYFGHREADLAMTELFGRLPADFYYCYAETWPLQPGYEDRRDLYNLYHMLNHLNLFGASYLEGVRSIVRRFA